MIQKSASKSYESTPMTEKSTLKTYVSGVFSPRLLILWSPQAFCREVVLWKRLEHPNIVPFIGATIDPFQTISVWMARGKLLEYISAHPHVDRLGLVGPRRTRVRWKSCLPCARYLMLLRVLVIFTLIT